MNRVDLYEVFQQRLSTAEAAIRQNFSLSLFLSCHIRHRGHTLIHFPRPPLHQSNNATRSYMKEEERSGGSVMTKPTAFRPQSSEIWWSQMLNSKTLVRLYRSLYFQHDDPFLLQSIFTRREGACEENKEKSPPLHPERFCQSNRASLKLCTTQTSTLSHQCNK